MAKFRPAKWLFRGKGGNASSTLATLPMRCLCCFAFELRAQMLNLLVHAPSIYKRLMQVGNRSPTGGIGLGVGTIFGLIH
ncbi:DUF2755 family protein [Shigella flexneri]